MTDRIETEEPLPEPLHAIVEAFLDGEAVEPALLRQALGDPAARDHFVDLLLIRRALSSMDSVAIGGVHPSPRSGGLARWLTVAAAAIISVSIGYLAGQRVMAATTAPSTVEAVVVVDSVPAVPEATRSITLKPGVNWTDSSGGK